MKKFRMLLLFGGLLLMLVGYGAWCGRTFYMRPLMPDLGGVPVEVREFARAGIEESSFFRPERLSFKRVKKLLTKPFESEPVPILIEPTPQMLIISRSGQTQSLVLMNGKNGWKTFWVKSNNWDEVYQQVVSYGATLHLAVP